MIVEAASELDLPFSFDNQTDVEAISPQARMFQEAICAYLGWANPSEIAGRWAQNRLTRLRSKQNPAGARSSSTIRKAEGSNARKTP